MLVESDLLCNGGLTTEKVTVLLLLPPSGILFPLHNRAIRRCKILQVNDGGCDKGGSAALLAYLMNAKATLLAPSVQFSCSLGSRRPPRSSLINRIFIISQHYNLLSIAVTSVFLLVEQIRIVPFVRSVGGGSGHASTSYFPPSLVTLGHVSRARHAAAPDRLGVDSPGPVRGGGVWGPRVPRR